MEVIGISGGVGSGKSTVSHLLEEEYGAYIINTDKIAHKLMEKGCISYNLTVEHFGPSILDKAGKIDRGKLGSIVYKDKNELLKLNSFSHPYVMKEVADIIKEKSRENYAYACIETALPQEANLKDICDRIWFVHTPIDLRIRRLKESRNYSDEKIKKIMNKQLSDEEYKNYASDVIINAGTKDELRNQINELLDINK